MFVKGANKTESIAIDNPNNEPVPPIIIPCSSSFTLFDNQTIKLTFNNSEKTAKIKIIKNITGTEANKHKNTKTQTK